MAGYKSPPIDTARPVKIGFATWEMLRLAGLGVIMTGVGALSGFRLIGDIAPGSFWQFTGLSGVAFFGFCTTVILWRMLKNRGTVVTLAPEGIRDERLAKAFVPWTAIRGISTWQSYGQKVMVLDVEPSVEQTLPLSKTAAWTRGANSRLGADGLCVTATGLAVSHDRLLEMALAFRAAARRPA